MIKQKNFDTHKLINYTNYITLFTFTTGWNIIIIVIYKESFFPITFPWLSSVLHRNPAKAAPTTPAYCNDFACCILTSVGSIDHVLDHICLRTLSSSTSPARDIPPPTMITCGSMIREMLMQKIAIYSAA